MSLRPLPMITSWPSPLPSTACARDRWSPISPAATAGDVRLRPPSSKLENAERNGRVLQLQQRQGDVVNGNAGGGFTIHAAVVGMAMKDEVSAVPVGDFGQARGAQVGINFGGFALHGGTDGGVMNHDNALFGAQLRHGAFQFEGLVNRGLHEGLDGRFAKGGKHAAAEAAGKALGAGKTHAVALVGGPV